MMLLKMLHEDAQNNQPQVSSESGDRILRQGGGGAVSDDLMRARRLLCGTGHGMLT